jgi:hypothetical protein
MLSMWWDYTSVLGIDFEDPLVAQVDRLRILAEREQGEAVWGVVPNKTPASGYL